MCHLIKKMEFRFGSDEAFLNPLRVEASLFHEGESAYLPVRVTRHAEPSIKVVQRLWDSRKHRLHRVRNEAPTLNQPGGHF